MSNQTIETIKAKLDILRVAEQYCELKKINNNTYKAVINPIREEKTSSLCFYSNTQKYHDFGSSESGDVFDLISKCENISLSEVLKRYKDDALVFTPQPIQEQQTIQEIEISSEQLQREFDNFERLNKRNPRHLEELFSVIPEYLLQDAHKEDLKLLNALSRYDRYSDTFVMGWCRNLLLDFEIVTYKRRRLHGAKWVNRKDTHPNSTAFNRIYDDNKPVYVVEGARDALTAIAMGLNVIAIPTTSFRNIDTMLSMLKPWDKVIFLCEDMAGYRAMKYLASAIPNSERVTFVQSENEKIDLSDVANNFTSLKGVLDAIS
ncbi:CHC2 zinc finger domain-containing protein [Sulfurimonas sp.]|uniref:CHC2 zinc finger domain-containing protein n=1 Tax=Sulfurimonas sp. TaxID=2022749 RepID=UPI003D1065E0